MNSARTTKGWVRIERSVWEHPVLQDDGPMTRKEAWLWMVAHADYEGAERGSLHGTSSQMAGVMGWTRHQLR